jgi:hypothetical protein
MSCGSVRTCWRVLTRAFCLAGSGWRDLWLTGLGIGEPSTSQSIGTALSWCPPTAGSSHLFVQLFVHAREAVLQVDAFASSVRPPRRVLSTPTHRITTANYNSQTSDPAQRQAARSFNRLATRAAGYQTRGAEAKFNCSDCVFSPTYCVCRDTTARPTTTCHGLASADCLAPAILIVVETLVFLSPSGLRDSHILPTRPNPHLLVMPATLGINDKCQPYGVAE